MQALFDSGRIVDLILALMAFEALALAVLFARTRSGVRLRRLLPNLLAGAGLLLALRAALTAQPFPVTAAWLLLGLLGHLVDLALRWESPAPRAPRTR
jgi:hypothetical protein